MIVFSIVDVKKADSERSQGAKGPLREQLLLSLVYNISPCETEGRFRGGTSLPHKERKLHVKASAKRDQDLEKSDVTGRGEIYIGFDDSVIAYFSQRHCSATRQVCYALVLAIKHCRQRLWEKHIVGATDNASLQYLPHARYN